MSEHLVPRVAGRVAGRLASYGAASVAELDVHLAALYVRAQAEPKDTRRAAWGDINALLDARYAMTTAETSAAA